MTQYRVFDEQGLLHAWFQRLPGKESDPRYFSIQDKIAENCPETIKFGLTRLPIVGELLQVNRFFWQVQQVVHYQSWKGKDPYNVHELLTGSPEPVAIIHICFYGAEG